MKRIQIAASLIIVLFFGLLIPAHSRQAVTGQTQRTIELMVPMRDGIKLSTSVFLPEGKGPWPAVLTRTPYGKGFSANPAVVSNWTSRGYAFVVQECRGTARSEGKNRPFMDDHVDGYDTVEWAGGQSWCNGRVGLFGASAMGIAANMAAMMNPPHLVAMFVIVARSSAYHQSSFAGGVFRKEMNESWLKRQKADWLIADILKHNVLDGFFDLAEMPKQWEQIQAPVYNFGGWYDIFNQGSIDNFLGLQAKGGGAAAGNQKLIMGPWGHGQIEEVKYPENAGDGILGRTPTELAVRWFDYWLKNIQNGIMDEPPVRYYVMGDVTDPKAPGNEWRTSLIWPVPARTTSYFLAAGGGLTDKLPSDQESADSYSYDPKNPVPTIGGANLFSKKGPMDQRAVGQRKDLLKFSTEVLRAPVEVTGPVTVELWAESDAPDTDFMAKLVDVYPDGTERLVLDSAIRARFREGFDHEVLMKKGEVYKLKIDLWSTSIIFNKGHRIGVHVTSSNDPRFDPNPNTGHPPRADNETRVAVNSIHHDRKHPSRVLLPIVPLNGKQP